MSEFPKMIYRPRNGPNPDVGGLKLEARIVESLGEQKASIKMGWIENFVDAIAIVERADARAASIQRFKDWYQTWEWAIKASAVFVALITGTVALIKSI